MLILKPDYRYTVNMAANHNIIFINLIIINLVFWYEKQLLWWNLFILSSYTYNTVLLSSCDNVRGLSRTSVVVFNIWHYGNIYGSPALFTYILGLICTTPWAKFWIHPSFVRSHVVWVYLIPLDYCYIPV